MMISNGLQRQSSGGATATANPSGAPTPASTPVLNNGIGGSRKRRGGIGSRLAPSSLLSVEFSQEVTELPPPALPPAIAEKPGEEEEEESDTDVGSDVDADVSFEGEEASAMAGSLFEKWAANGADRCDDSSPTISVSRVGAKVRRLNLDDGDVKRSSGVAERAPSDFNFSPARTRKPARVSHGYASTIKQRSPPSSPSGDGGDGGMPICPPSAARKGRGDAGERRSHPSSPSRDGGDHGMLICPPSTARKGRGGMSRLFARDASPDASPDFGGGGGGGPINFGTGKGEEREDDVGMGGGEEDDVSPRDVVDFPFFPESPPGSDLNEAASFMESLKRPPSTLKKPSRRAMDLNDTKLLSSSPPRGLRSLGRANSFLQMFSQGSADSFKGTESIEEGHDGASDGEDFLRRPSRDDGFRPATVPSPKRPIRRNRLTPSSCGNHANDSSSFSRFLNDFEVVGTLGDGAFGCVYSVRNRTDRRMYAIKAARREARGESDRKRMLREVYALAALGDKACEGEMHIVRYHQAWMEGNRLYIQTELCEMTLSEEMKVDSCMSKRRDGGKVVGGLMGEGRRFKLLREMLLALDLVHKSGMIHLDIKPENIFIKNDHYKLGDFGLVSKIESHDDVEEGDSRYMSMELLSGDLDDLTKSDIFSLGATLYEICLLGRPGPPEPLPENGQRWRDMREGNLLPMPGTPFDMQMIVREMMAPDKRDRPSAEELLKRRRLLSDEQRQLIVERNKATAANRALDVQMQRFKLLSPKNGRKFERSNTIC